MRWTWHLEGGPKRVNHAAVVVGHHIYSFGGYCTSDDYTTFKSMDVHALNTVTMRWTLVPQRKDQEMDTEQVPFQRYGHTAVAYKQFAIIWGGRNDAEICNVLYQFDTLTKRWSAPVTYGCGPGARDGHSACVVEDKMFIFGGFENSLVEFSRDLHCLDLKTMTWTFVLTSGPPPSYRDFHTATPIGDRIYVWGGRGDVDSPYHSDSEIYDSAMVYVDLKTRTWHTPNTTGQLPIGRRSHSAFAYKNRIYIFGGFNGIHDNHFNDLYCFDPALNNWSLVKPQGPVLCSRRRHVSLVIDDRAYIFGGTRYEAEMSSNPTLADFDDTQVLDLRPSLRTLAMTKVLDQKLDYSALPNDIKWEIRMMTTHNNIARPPNHNG